MSWLDEIKDILFGSDDPVEIRNPLTGELERHNITNLVATPGGLGGAGRALLPSGTRALATRGLPAARSLPAARGLPATRTLPTRASNVGGRGGGLGAEVTGVYRNAPRALRGGGNSRMAARAAYKNAPPPNVAAAGGKGGGLGFVGWLAGAAGAGGLGALAMQDRNDPAQGGPPSGGSGGGRSLPAREGGDARLAQLAGRLQQEQPQAPQSPGQGNTGPSQDDLLAMLGGAYDSQIAALAGLGDVYDDQAQLSQGRIGEFFDYARAVAEGGRGPLQETYDTAQGNVGTIYDTLAEDLAGIPQQQADIASAAAGGSYAPGVAAESAKTTAPFAAAGKTASANARSDLTKRNAAGQTYLTQLASAVPAEGALHQSAVEQANAQQQQMLAYKQAELEGAKARALAEVAADISGDTAERQAQAALGAALGTPEGVDPLDYLKGVGMQQDLLGGTGGGQEMGHENLQNAYGYLQQAESQLGNSQFRNLDSIFQDIIDQIDAEYLGPTSMGEDRGTAISEQQLLGRALDLLTGAGDEPGFFEAHPNAPEKDALANALRIYYGG